MAPAKSSVSLSDRLFSIAAALSGCHEVANALAGGVLSDCQNSVLWLLEAQLGRLAEELTDISESDEVRARGCMEAAA